MLEIIERLKELPTEELQKLRAAIDAELEQRKSIERSKVRLIIPSVVLGDWRKATTKPIAKEVKSIDKSQKGMWMFVGNLVPLDREFEIPEGTIIVIVSGEGSWKHPSSTMYVCAAENGASWKWGRVELKNLKLLCSFDVPERLLTAADAIEAILQGQSA